LKDKFIPIQEYDGKTDTLQKSDGLPEVPHAWEANHVYAINAALATGRPLLIRGEPGTGKSQLARAAAHILKRRFLWKVVDARTEISDLFYHFDAVERLGYAQVLGAFQQADQVKLLKVLGAENFMRPGPLWDAFDCVRAGLQRATYAKRDQSILQACSVGSAPKAKTDESQPPGGEQSDEIDKTAPAAKAAPAESPPCVVLIDEIDKTDPSVPNGLLEALGQGTFPIPGSDRTISWHSSKQPKNTPLIVFTTNEARELPDAFVRRCLVLHLLLPSDSKLVEWLVARGRVHFSADKLSDDVLKTAAEYVVQDRQRAGDLGLSKPGQAEYLDLLRAVFDLSQQGEDPMKLLKNLRSFALHKHREVYKRALAEQGVSARELQH